ncbi:SHOCT domain-containing protein [Halorientalis halophila]|uniref:SHOCT domain-containing protein n=1 Tax=Halorientalis halophila TaxID=3108499 RepID=UPI003007F3F8
MDESRPLDRLRENLTGIVSTLVTGIWLAAMFLDQSWWLGFMLFGYVVLVPLTAVLFGDEGDFEAWWDSDAERDPETTPNDRTESEDPLTTLRERYARGELTDEQFERKLERLLETETLEDAAEGVGADAADSRSTVTGSADRKQERERSD